MATEDEISREDAYRIGFVYGQALREIPTQELLRRRKDAATHPIEAMLAAKRKVIGNGSLSMHDMMLQELVLSAIPADILMPDRPLQKESLMMSWEQGVDDGIEGQNGLFVGVLLARRREELGLTQMDIVEISDYSIATVSRIEIGKCTEEQLCNYQELLRKLELEQALMPEESKGEFTMEDMTMNEIRELMTYLYRSGSEFGMDLIPDLASDKTSELIWRVNDMLEEYGLEWNPYQEAIFISEGKDLEYVERQLPERDFDDLFFNEIVPEAAYDVAGVIIRELPDDDE